MENSRKSFRFPIVGECARCAIWFARNITNARRELRMHSILFFQGSAVSRNSHVHKQAANSEESSLISLHHSHLPFRSRDLACSGT